MSTRAIPLSPKAIEYRRRGLRAKLATLPTPALVALAVRLQLAVYLQRVRLALGVR